MRNRTALHPRLSDRLKSQGAHIIVAPKAPAARPTRADLELPLWLRIPPDRTLMGVNAAKHWRCNECIEKIVSEWNPCNRLEAQQALETYFAKN